MPVLPDLALVAQVLRAAALRGLGDTRALRLRVAACHRATSPAGVTIPVLAVAARVSPGVAARPGIRVARGLNETRAPPAPNEIHVAPAPNEIHVAGGPNTVPASIAESVVPNVAVILAPQARGLVAPA